MNLSRKTLAEFSVFWMVFSSFVAAEIPCEGDFTFKTTLKQDTIDVDATLKLSLIGERFKFTSTWKATEKGFSSLKFVGEAEFPKDIEGKCEILFGEDGLESIKLKGADLPFWKALLDLETYYKLKGLLTLYQITVGLDDLTLVELPASVDLIFREAYLRAKLSLDHEDNALSVQEIWKKGTIYEANTTLEHDHNGWSVKEVLTFKPNASRLHLKKGKLTINRDLPDALSLKVVCDHTFPEGRIKLTKAVSTIELEVGTFKLTWKGTFKPMAATLRLEAHTLTLVNEVEINDLSLGATLKINEDGLPSFSVQLSCSV